MARTAKATEGALITQLELRRYRQISRESRTLWASIKARRAEGVTVEAGRFDLAEVERKSAPNWKQAFVNLAKRQGLDAADLVKRVEAQAHRKTTTALKIVER